MLTTNNARETRFGNKPVAAIALSLTALLAVMPAVAAPPGPPLTTHVFEVSDEQDVLGQLQHVVARHEDTLPDIGRLFDLGHDEIARANPEVDVWLPGEGKQILLPTQFVLPEAPREGLVINVAAMRAYYYPPRDKDGRQRVYTHPIGIGRLGWATPLGTTSISAKAKDPSWYVPKSILKEHEEEGDPLPPIVPPGPDNPLGRYALRLAMPGYLIHGTNQPWGVGLRVSHGCIRLYPEDIEALFEMIPRNTAVHIVEQPYLVGWHDGRLLFTAHMPLEESGGDWLATLELIDRHLGEAPQGIEPRDVDWGRVARIARAGNGIALPIEIGTPAPAEWVATVPTVRTEAVANYRPSEEEESAPEG
ncbi:MAG: L,D-transpeptidase family protein [Gammaproteobacteria bacterium]